MTDTEWDRSVYGWEPKLGRIGQSRLGQGEDIMTDAEWNQLVYVWNKRGRIGQGGNVVAKANVEPGVYVVQTVNESNQPARWPTQPPIGSVLRFEKRYTPNGRVYTYVAIRVDRRQNPWFVTGQIRTGPAMDWEALCEMIGKGNRCEIATAWFEIPTVPDEDAVAAQLNPSEYIQRYWPTSESVVE